MRCEAITKKGAPCARSAMVGERRCVSHAGRCGARPGNRNALRHGLYSQILTPGEKAELIAALAVKGIDQEIAVTRLMIRRGLRARGAPAEAHARLVEALCRQLRLQRQLSGEGADRMADAMAAFLNEIADALGLDAG